MAIIARNDPVAVAVHRVALHDEAQSLQRVVGKRLASAGSSFQLSDEGGHIRDRYGGRQAGMNHADHQAFPS